jgi:hypothetical protein
MSERRVNEKVLDNYAEFEYKSMFLHGATAPELLPNWIPADDRRRLRSYQILESFCRNKGREWVPLASATKDDARTEMAKRREYGDPDLLVETALSSVIGDNWRIVTQGVIEGDTAAVEQDKELRDWADDVNFAMKMYESERQSVKFGDSIYTLGMTDDGRLTLDVFDPGFYFPVLDAEAPTTEYPDKVHIAWEWEDEDRNGNIRFMITRLTWELVEAQRPYTLPWNPQATKVCMYSETTIDVADLPRTQERSIFYSMDDIQPDKEVNMGIDFMPVVHVPNTINLQHHFGRSALSNVMQLLDDIQATDTDLQASSSTTGSPPIVVTGRGANADDDNVYGPGTIIRVGDGTATIMDTSRSLDALLKMKDSLLSRLSINSRTPEALLGRVKPNEVPSGIALTLGFTPHINLVRQMRTVRTRKYNLLFKFAKRMMSMSDRYELAPGFEEHRTDLVMGSFLPADLMGVTTVVIQLLETKAISLETAVQMLTQAGVSVENVSEEISNIQKRDTETATALVGITGDPNDALKYLGMPLISDSELDDFDPGTAPGAGGLTEEDL